MPNRIISDSICFSDDIDSLSPFAKTVLVRLMDNTDGDGRMEARLSHVKDCLYHAGESVTADMVQMALDEMADRGIIRYYEVDGTPYLQLTNWAHYQSALKKREPSREKAPEEARAVLPLRDGMVLRVYRRDIDVWSQQFAGVDVERQLARMREWLERNPQRQKEAGEMLGWICRWLAREKQSQQNRNGSR